MKRKVFAFSFVALGMLATFSLGVTFFQNPQNFRWHIGRLILDFADDGSADVSVDDFGLGYVSFNDYSYGSSGQSSFFLPFGQGKGIFSIGAFVDGWTASEGFASIDAFMTTTIRCIFDCPKNMPLEGIYPDSVGFVLFMEGRANAWAHGPLPSDSPGYAFASGDFATELISASASIYALFPNPPYMPFDVYDYDPDQGDRRDATIKAIDITSGQGEYIVKFSGSASTRNFNAMGVGSAYAQTGIVVLADIPQSLNPHYYPPIDPLGVPEVGDNEYVFHPILNQLIIPVGARICAGFNPDDSLLQWLTPKLSWELSPSLPVPNPEYPLPNGCEGDLIFPQTLDIYGIKWRGLVFWTGRYLPATNGDFGRRQVIMKFNGNFVHAANVEIFFPATAINHPPLGNDEGSGNPPDEGWQFIGNTAAWVIKSPNWFYYYWMAAYRGNFTIRYANSDTSFYYDGDQYVHIGNMAYQPYSMRCFRIVNGHIQHADILYLKGIHTFIYAVEHELAHKRHYEAGIYPQTPDTDGDQLSDDWEIAHFLDPNKSDTTRAYGDDPIGDLQCIADIEAYGKLLLKRDLWKKDWADTGLQKGPPPFNPMPWRYWSSGTNVSAFNDLLQAIP